ncbi:2-succinyl-6-hydroxy-2,4-cyclohexadiene-1-carboxylate synthase [Pleurocapsales cyanobacterium LEGE 10410]|nr:2-succinyl-6-hydroxy-2,4-cyclohexadiene-1-carboxylate synthase [Pleurocapsales cyanobacterium LEGE 10410]
MGNSQDFLTVISNLSEFCCLVVDLPGHGNTEVAGELDYQMPQIAQALIGLLNRLAIEQCFLVGYSMGGRIALYLTVYFPQYFQGVILESASPGLATQPERDRRIEQDWQLAARLESQGLAQFLKQWYANPIFASFVRHPNYEQAIAHRQQNEPNKLVKSLRYTGLGMQPSLWHCLSNIQIPILLVVGEFDAKFVAINQKIAGLCRQSKLNIVKNSGHNVHFEQPKEFIKLVKLFARSC